jgi:hypothetical protein
VDDVVAETFAIAWRRLPREVEPLPWLYTVAGRVVHRHRRSQARRARILHRLTHRDTAVDATEPSALIVEDPVLATAFATLTRREREAICLALVATLVLALTPSGGPSDRSILVSAVQASELPRGTIIVIDSVAELNGARTSLRDWIRTDLAGARCPTTGGCCAFAARCASAAQTVASGSTVAAGAAARVNEIASSSSEPYRSITTSRG